MSSWRLCASGQPTTDPFRFAAALQELDLEGDWDPSKHDAQMTALYSEDINEDAEVSKTIMLGND